MKTVEKKYFVCEICGKTSQIEEKIKECQQGHRRITEDVAVEVCNYRKGAVLPEAVNFVFPDGLTAQYYLKGAIKKGE